MGEKVGWAFPNESIYDDRKGMSLRDWFAANALPMIVDRPLQHGMSNILPGSPMHPQKAAAAAYRYADAMLAERKKDSQ